VLDQPASCGGGERPTLVDGPVQVYAGGPLGEAGSVTDALRALVAAVPERGYLAVQAYLDRLEDASTALLRPELARRTGLPTTFGWGPRFLHSTGQYHKGGHPNGVFLQLTGEAEEDVEVPGRPYTLAGLQLAQALGDGRVLAERGRPVLRLHLTDRLAGLSHVMKAVQELP
jgi:glucose-6-phosphate isomerase